MLFFTAQDVPEIVKTFESEPLLLSNFLNNPDEAVRKAFFSSINAYNVGVQASPLMLNTLYHTVGNGLVTD